MSDADDDDDAVADGASTCAPDARGCCRLSHVLRSFHAALNEEQAWSVAHQAVLVARDCFARRPLDCRPVSDARHVFVHKDGTIDERTFCGRDARRASWTASSGRDAAVSEAQLIASLGVVLFEALDFGLCEDEERSLSKPLETLIDRMTGGGRGRRRDDEDRDDEGIERDHDDDEITFERVLHMCRARLTSGDADSHYKAVCRALVAEAVELATFLEQIGRQETEDTALDALQFHDWARLWIQVVGQLRHGVKLNKVGADLAVHASEFELTPYEMLLDDIRFRRYKLNKVMVDGRLPPRLKKDAHALILDFIRSRPPLVPVSRRVLAAPPPKHETLYDKLMHSIRQQHKLRPIAAPHAPLSAHSTPTRVKRNAETSRAADAEATPTRRLIKADLTLRFDSNSFDDDDEHDVDRRSEHDIDDDDVDDSVFDVDDQQRRRFSLKKRKQAFEFEFQQSLRSRPLLATHDRRHSIPTCESVADDDDTIDVNADARQHVAAIWQSTEWGRALECLSLTLQEVQHIRSVLTKAEIETLAVTKALRDDLENGKICFTCLKTRFSFFGARPTACKLCERAICDRCCTRISIPCERFDRVPIYMLSPSPSPPHERPWPEPDSQPQSLPPSGDRKSRLMRVWSRSKEAKAAKTAAAVGGGVVARVCRDCKLLVRHLIDFGHTGFDSASPATAATDA